MLPVVFSRQIWFGVNINVNSIWFFPPQLFTNVSLYDQSIALSDLKCDTGHTWVKHLLTLTFDPEGVIPVLIEVESVICVQNNTAELFNRKWEPILTNL